MRIAFLTPTLPWPANTGGTLRTYHLLRGLAQRHKVDLFCFHYGPPPRVDALAAICNQVTPIQLGQQHGRYKQLQTLLDFRPRSVSYFTTAAAKATMDSYLQSDYELIVCDEIIIAPYLDGHLATPTLLLRPKIDYLHYAEVAAERAWGLTKLLDLLESRRLRHYESVHLPNYAAAVVCSPDDRQVTRAQCNSLLTYVLPNGADMDYFQPHREPASAPTILLMGTMHYYPNVDAVIHFFDTMYPALHATFPDLQVLITGHRPPAELREFAKLPGVTVTGSVEDVRPYMARSWVLAVPLRLGGGTRLKIVEAFAAELPVVSTTIGAQGLDVEDGKHLLLADEPSAFIAATERILTTPTLARQLALAGRALAQSTYSWHSLGARFAEICEQTAAA